MPTTSVAASYRNGSRILGFPDVPRASFSASPSLAMPDRMRVCAPGRSRTISSHSLCPQMTFVDVADVCFPMRARGVWRRRGIADRSGRQWPWLRIAAFTLPYAPARGVDSGESQFARGEAQLGIFPRGPALGNEKGAEARHFFFSDRRLLRRLRLGRLPHLVEKVTPWCCCRSSSTTSFNIWWLEAWTGF